MLLQHRFLGYSQETWPLGNQIFKYAKTCSWTLGSRSRPQPSFVPPRNLFASSPRSPRLTQPSVHTRKHQMVTYEKAKSVFPFGNPPST
jgi:hypothetical protein